MTLSKTSVHPVDLDDLERELRSIAVSALRERSDDDALAELARMVGRDPSLQADGRSQGSQTAPQATPHRLASHQGSVVELRPRSQGAALADSDLRPSINEAVWRDRPRDTEKDCKELVFGPGEPAAEVRPQAHPEGLGQTRQNHAALAEDGDTAWLDTVGDLPIMSDAAALLNASASRSVMLPLALALALSLMLVTIGVGAVVFMRGGTTNSIANNGPTAKASDAPAKLQPVKAAGDDQLASQPAPGAAAAPSRPSQAGLAPAAQPPTVTAGAKAREFLDPAGAQPSAVRPGTDGVYSAALQQSPAAGSASAAAADPAPMPTAPANESLQSLQLASQDPIFGTPHRVSTVSIKADGSIASGNKPKADAPKPAATLAVSAADPTSANASSANVSSNAGTIAPWVKKRPNTVSAKSSATVAVDAPQSKKSLKPLASSATPENNQQPQPAAEPPAPAPIAAVASVLRTVFQGSHAQSAQPAATAADAQTNVATGGSVSIKLASTHSERDARATLSRLQQQFPGTLADASVRREDTGSRGVLYRVGVGPLSREAADKICSQLKAGGTSCAMSGR